MTFSSEQPPIQQPIPEKPASYSVLQLLETFAEEDIQAVAAYHQELMDSPVELVRRPLPVDFLRTYRDVAAMLTYNVTTKYSEGIENALQEDPVIALIKQQQINPERPRALCARRSVVAYLVEASAQHPSSGISDSEPQAA